MIINVKNATIAGKVIEKIEIISATFLHKPIENYSVPYTTNVVMNTKMVSA